MINFKCTTLEANENEGTALKLNNKLKQNNEIYKVMKNFKYGFADIYGNLVAKPQFDYVFDPSDGYWQVAYEKHNKNGCVFRQGYMDNHGELILFCHEVNEFREGRALFKQAGKYGFLDTGLSVAIDPVFGFATDFHDGLALTVIKNRSVFINHDGEPVLETGFHPELYFQEGYCKVRTAKGYNFIDKKGRLVTDLYFEKSFDYKESYAAVQSNGKWGFINWNGKLTVDCSYDAVMPFQEGYAAVMQGEKWGHINKKGELISGFKHSTGYFFKEGLARVIVGGEPKKLNGVEYGNIGGKSSYIDYNGNEIIGPGKYEYEYDFHDGVVTVASMGKYGFMNKQGEIIVKPQYDDAEDFKDGIVHVSIRGNGFYINKNGDIVLSLKI